VPTAQKDEFEHVRNSIDDVSLKTPRDIEEYYDERIEQPTLDPSMFTFPTASSKHSNSLQ
jgi:hypothetical protein